MYDEKADIWSLGAVVYEALTGCQPFLADGAAEMAAVVAARLEARDAASGLPQFLARQASVSAEAKDFVARCLEARPEARPSAAELLAHPWVARRASMAEERPTADAAVALAPGAAHGWWDGSALAAFSGSAAQQQQQQQQPARGGLRLSDASDGGGVCAPAGRPSLHELLAGAFASDAAAGDPGAPAAGLALAGSVAARRSREGVSALHRSSSVAGEMPLEAGPYLTTRSNTTRLEGSMPGRRAAAAAQLAGIDGSGD